MISIQIDRNGVVSGDVNAIVGNDSDRFSKPIRILHPDFKNVVHKVIIRQGREQITEVINADDFLVFPVLDNGLIHMQYVAECTLDGESLLTSRIFDMVIARSNMKPSGEDPKHRMHSPKILEQELFEISDRLKAVGILEGSKQALSYNCDSLVEDKEYVLAENSINTPEGPQSSIDKYLMRVICKEGVAIQLAQRISGDTNGIFYRSGAVQSDNAVLWNSWESLFANTQNCEQLTNKVTSLHDELSEDSYPTARAVKDYVDAQISSLLTEITKQSQ